MRIKVAIPEVNEKGQNCCVNKKEPNSIASLTLGIIKVFSNNFSRLLPLFTVLQRQRRKAKKRSKTLIVKSIKKLRRCRFLQPYAVLGIEKAER